MRTSESKELWQHINSSAALNLKFLSRTCGHTNRNFKFVALAALVNGKSVGTQAFASTNAKRRRLGDCGERQSVEGRHAIGSDRVPTAQQPEFIEKICRDKRRRHARPALDQKPGDATFRQRAEHLRKIEPGRSRCD